MKTLAILGIISVLTMTVGAVEIYWTDVFTYVQKDERVQNGMFK